MKMHQHRRPLWIGLLACAMTPPAVYCGIAKITLLRLPFILATVQARQMMGLIFAVGLMFSAAMTFSIGLLVVVGLKKIYRLNAIYVCIAGALVGACFAFLLSRGTDLRTHATMPFPPAPALNEFTLRGMKIPAWIGFLAAAVLCLASGIPIRSVRKDQVADDISASLTRKVKFAFGSFVVAVSALVLVPLVSPLLSSNKAAFPNMPTKPPRAMGASSWDRTCPKEYASTNDPAIEPIETDVAQLVVQASDGDATALAKLKQFAKGGNELAQLKLGKLYDADCHDGHGVPHDAAQAARWLELAARQGNMESASLLGILYQKGDGGVTKDPALSLYWFGQSTVAGDGNAYVAGGRRIRKVIVNGLPQWPVETMDVVAQTRVSAEQGNAKAQNDLGEMIERGMAGPMDFTQAGLWFEKSAMQGYAPGQRNLGLLYKYGRGARRGTTQTLSWLTNAAMQNDAPAAYELGLIYESGLLVPKDFSAAAHWYTVAAEHGSMPGQRLLATMYAKGQGLPKDDAKALEWFLIFFAHTDNLQFSDDVMGQVEARMAPDQLQMAERAARERWKSQPSLSENRLPP